MANGRKETTEAVEDASNAVASGAKKVQSSIEHGTDMAGDLAAKASDSIREYTGRADDAAESVARKMDDASDYLHDADTGRLGSDIASYVKEHPLQAVAAAVVGGFLIGRMLSR
jgi:ElaB/YqjD/DUF883 family membrane-anchored ribosome-binding protein